MKYGLVVYKDTDNIGDDILSYAAAQFLPQIDYIIDREQLDIFSPEKKEMVSVIMNGWFLYHKSHWPPSPYINPLFIGIHFSDNKMFGIEDAYLNGAGRDYLNKHKPIGCRDEYTLEKMKARDIQAYFSGCLTLTLNPFSDVKKNDRYILVDVPDIVCQKMISTVGTEQVEQVSHNVDRNYDDLTWKERSAVVEIFLKKYQAAKMVVTTRLHCALPCLALGTPVLLLMDNNPDTKARMGSYTDFVQHCSTHEFLNDILYWVTNFSNPTQYIELRNNIISRCESFVNQSEDPDERGMSAQVPDLDSFNRLWKEPTLWQRSLLSDNTICARNTEWDSLIETNKWLEDQRKWKDCRIKELEARIEELEKGKEWLEEHAAEQERYIHELQNR